MPACQCKISQIQNNFHFLIWTTVTPVGFGGHKMYILTYHWDQQLAPLLSHWKSYTYTIHVISTEIVIFMMLCKTAFSFLDKPKFYPFPDEDGYDISTFSIVLRNRVSWILPLLPASNTSTDCFFKVLLLLFYACCRCQYFWMWRKACLHSK